MCELLPSVPATLSATKTAVLLSQGYYGILYVGYYGILYVACCDVVWHVAVLTLVVRIMKMRGEKLWCSSSPGSSLARQL